MKKIILLLSALCGLGRLAAADSLAVGATSRPGDFAVAQGKAVAPITVAPGDFECVRLAAHLLADDVERVTGRRPIVAESDAAAPGGIVVGTLGQSPLIDRLAAAHRLDVSRLQGQWESFLITTVDGSLVIAGSDRRGTAFGVFELSRAIGVSPWYWWADVSPAHRENLFIAAGTRKFGPPSVQYRGIFINDEDWGIQPWAAKGLDAAAGNIGPKTYARICELLLRLKANTLWPAMHEVSAAFNSIPENKLVADRYGIVMGSSHCEPLLRNNVGEWPKDNQAAFNFLTNPAGVTRYWEERLQTNGRFENFYTIGMRGIHDGPMQGPKGDKQIVDTLQKVMAVQRGLLARYVNADPAQVPQIFCPYKEVLNYFLHDLQVPPDVTVVFPDDNFGYIRYFPTPEQIAARPGGFGVYYHLSYLGAPLSYVWLNTTPPALIWEEMHKAYEHRVRKLWMLNVGDLKPGEIGIDFFMQMGWDIGRWSLDTLPEYLRDFAAGQFGPAQAPAIARLLAEYYRLGYQRKPEHLQWYVGREQPRPSDFTYTNYGNEGLRRLASYRRLASRAQDLATSLPAEQQAAFYELVEYPILGATAANERLIADESAQLSLRQGRADVADWAGEFAAGTEALRTETARYNEGLVPGKWNGVMEDDPLLPSRAYRNATLRLPTAVARFEPGPADGVGVAIEGRTQPLAAGETAPLPALDPFLAGERFIDVFARGLGTQDYVLTTDCDWIELHRAPPHPNAGRATFHASAFHSGSVLHEPENLLVSVDWAKAPLGADVEGHVRVRSGDQIFTVTVPLFNPAEIRPAQLAGQFVASNGVVSIEADHFSRRVDVPGARWEVIPGLGRSGNAVTVLPTTAASVDLARVAAAAPALQYDFHLFQAGDATVRYDLIPTQPLAYGTPLRFAVGVDGEPPELVAVTAGKNGEAGVSRAWQESVLDNTTPASSHHHFGVAGPHTLKIYMIDPGVVLEKIVIDQGGLRPSYLGPPETRVAVQP